MSEILFHYQKIDPTTWVYVSSLLMFGLFFQFNRFWSVRNLDLVLLILLAPGLLMVNQARENNKPSRRSLPPKETTTTDLAAAAGNETTAPPNEAAASSSPSAVADATAMPAIDAAEATEW